MKFLVLDKGFGIEHATRLAKDGNEVRLSSPWTSNFPTFLDYAPGLGMKGIDKVLYFYDHLDWADYVCFFDNGFGDLEEFLRKKGYKVFGAGLKGEQLENHRYLARWIQNNLKLPTQATYKVTGTDNLRKFLKTHANMMVKRDIFRGDLETMKAHSLEDVEQLITDLEGKYGPFKNDAHFMVEEQLEGIEPGFDLFFNGKTFLKPYMWGYEISHAYIGRVVNDLPRPLKTIKDALEPYLAKINYRGAISIECMVLGDSRPFLIDFTSRMPFPLSYVYCENINNYSEIISGCADSKDVTIKWDKPYVGCIPVDTAYAKDHWVKVSFDPKLKDSIRMQSPVFVNGSYYSVRGHTNVANITVKGDSVDDIYNKTKNLVHEVKAHELENDERMGLMDVLRNKTKEGESKYGLDFGTMKQEKVNLVKKALESARK